MKIILKILFYFSFLLSICLVFIFSFWLIINFIKYVDEDFYSSLRDKARVFRTVYLRPNQKYRFTELHPIYNDIEVSNLVRVKNATLSKFAREKIINVIWDNPEIRFSITPTKILTLDINKTLKFLPNKTKRIVQKIEEIQYLSDKGFFSKSFYFVPKKSNGSLVIFHSGNTGSFLNEMSTIHMLLQEGYQVLAFSMWIIDKQPELYINGPGFIKFRDHSFLKFINEPLRVYFDPIISGLNYLTKNNDYKNIIAIGFSGGGWVITVLSAFDERIKLSYPIAASYPLYLRRFRNWSTWQETYPPLLDVANYLDLYLMASEGPGRRQVQVLNKYDGCCYSGLGWTTYASILIDISNKLGGEGWDIFIDDSHADHKISINSLNYILKDINKFK